MIRTAINNWWLLALRGVLATSFSIMAFLTQSSAESFTLREFATNGIVVLLGILAFAAGVSTVVAGIWKAEDRRAGLIVLDGVAVSAAGLVLIVTDAIPFSAAMYLLALAAVAIGLIEMAAAQGLRRHISDEWFLALAGLASVGFGLGFLVVGPKQPGSIFVWLGSYSPLSAFCMLGLSSRLRTLRASIHHLASAAAGGPKA